MTKQLLIGAHTSAAGGAPNALLEGREIGATTIQFFTSNQKQWQGRKITEAEIADWKQTLLAADISHVMSHDSYLINLGSPSADILDKSRTAFRHELERCHLFELSYLNFHPGAALDSPEQVCLDTIVESLLEFQDLVDTGPTRLLIETTAGQGSTVGYQFEQIGYLIHRLDKKLRIGVCIDTCHIFAAGYDIRTEEAWTQTLQQFDDVIGLNHLYALHLNDSMKELGSRVDRHACLGEGKIGIDAFKFVMTHPKLRNLPKYLETPEGPGKWKEEIALLRTFALENSLKI